MSNQNNAAEGRTHWKKLFNNDYLGAWSLKEGEEKIVTISKVSKSMVKSAQAPKGEECPVCYFKEFNIPMVLNATNCKRIGKMYGDIIEDWVGKTVTLYVEYDVKAFGTTTDALRVKEGKKLIDELRDLYNGLKDSLTDQERTRAERILNNNEKPSFGKLYNFLKLKFDEYSNK